MSTPDSRTDATSAPTAPKDAEPATRAANAAVLGTLPFDDTSDFDDANRGFVAPLPERQIRAKSGTMLWDLCAYDFLEKADAPPTVNPSLWRMARLNMASGLFEVCPRVYQVRGLDLANMTIVEGDSGLVIVDPLTTAEVASAALALYRTHRGERPVVAVVYSHSHVDHYGGVRGVISEDDVRARGVQVIAPDGFMEAVGGENVLAGNAMARRAQFQFGGLLRPGPRGQVDAGLGKTTARGNVGLIAPTRLIREPVETHVIDGIEIVFHLAPETEAPAEMHLFHAGAARAEHGRERDAPPAQRVPAARRGRARSAPVGALPVRRDRALRRRHRRADRPAPLADLGPREGARVPREAARPLQAHPRPDGSAHEPRLPAGGDRRGAAAAAGARARVERARLLRHDQPQREGDLPALPELVRRATRRT